MTGVKVRLFAHLRKLSKKPEIHIRIPSQIELKDFLKILAGKIKEELRCELFDENNNVRSGYLILVNGIEISALDGFNTKISNNDDVVILPFIHGGLG